MVIVSDGNARNGAQIGTCQHEDVGRATLKLRLAGAVQLLQATADRLVLPASTQMYKGCNFHSRMFCICPWCLVMGFVFCQSGTSAAYRLIFHAAFNCACNSNPLTAFKKSTSSEAHLMRSPPSDCSGRRALLSEDLDGHLGIRARELLIAGPGGDAILLLKRSGVARRGEQFALDGAVAILPREPLAARKEEGLAGRLQRACVRRKS